MEPTLNPPAVAEPVDPDPTAADLVEAAVAGHPLWRLSAADGDGPLRPAVTLGPAYPAAVSGLPAFYYWKDALRVGRYAHPGGRSSLHVTRDKLDGYARTFAAMRANGVGVPILADHAPSAAATLGWIVAVRRDGDRLLELHQFLGETARDTGLRNFVSLGIDPDFVDGRGVRYGEAIVHSAVTPVPVVPGQDGFVEAAAEELGGGRATVTLSRVDPADIADDDRQGNGVPAAASVLAMSLLADAAGARRDLAVARGGVDPATADAVLALLLDDTAAPAVTLSRAAGGRPLAVAVFDALAANRPVPLGEATGPQSVGGGGRLHLLARSVPGAEPPAELTGRMIAWANGRDAS